MIMCAFQRVKCCRFFWEILWEMHGDAHMCAQQPARDFALVDTNAGASIQYCLLPLLLSRACAKLQSQQFSRARAFRPRTHVSQREPGNPKNMSSKLATYLLANYSTIVAVAFGTSVAVGYTYTKQHGSSPISDAMRSYSGAFSAGPPAIASARAASA